MIGFGLSELIAIGLIVYVVIRIRNKYKQKSHANAEGVTKRGSMEGKPKARPDAPVEVPAASPSTPKITMEETRSRVNVGTELVHVAAGARITVSRSRTIEHTVNVGWRSSNGLDLGFQQFITAAIHREIERSTGRTIQHSEKVEYEVTLDGEKAQSWLLSWTDVFARGTIETSPGSSGVVPFEFRERSELDCRPTTGTMEAAAGT